MLSIMLSHLARPLILLIVALCGLVFLRLVFTDYGYF